MGIKYILCILISWCGDVKLKKHKTSIQSVHSKTTWKKLELYFRTANIYYQSPTIEIYQFNIYLKFLYISSHTKSSINLRSVTLEQFFQTGKFSNNAYYPLLGHNRQWDWIKRLHQICKRGFGQTGAFACFPLPITKTGFQCCSMPHIFHLLQKLVKNQSS